jgi:hypothetical protein
MLLTVPAIKLPSGSYYQPKVTLAIKWAID